MGATQYCSANQSRRVEWLCLGTNRGCEGVDSHMQFLLVRAANSSVVGKPEVIWAFQHFVARSRNGLPGDWAQSAFRSKTCLVSRLVVPNPFGIRSGTRLRLERGDFALVAHEGKDRQ